MCVRRDFLNSLHILFVAMATDPPFRFPLTPRSLLNLLVRCCSCGSLSIGRGDNLESCHLSLRCVFFFIFFFLFLFP